MDQQTLIAGAVTVGVGALSGGITNAVAVWMLFHPHESRGIGPFSIQGAIPKNKARLARSVGKVVGERLLTADDISRRLADPGLRGAFDAAITRGVSGLLERQHGSLRQSLTPDALAVVERALPGLGGRVAERVAQGAADPAFQAGLARLMERLASELSDRPIGAALGAEDRVALRAKVDQWVAGVVEGEAMASALRQLAGEQVERLVGDTRPLVERLPPGIVSAVEQGISDSLPGLVQRLGEVLGDPGTRAAVQTVLREAIDRAVGDLVLHQRLLAKLVVTDQSLARLLDSFAGEGADRLAAELRDGGLQGRVRGAVNDGVRGALRVPLGERLARLSPERRGALAASLADLVLIAARSGALREVLSQALDRFLEGADQKTWGALLRELPGERAGRLAAELLAGEPGRRWTADLATAAAQALLDRPIGRPADWLGPEGVATLARAASDAAWAWVHEQVPVVVGHIQVQEMVEQKVLGFSTQRMEEIVRNVTQRELDLIVNLGYWLGGLVGLAAFGVNLLLR